MEGEPLRTFGHAALIENASTWLVKVEPHVAMRMKRLFKRSDSGHAGSLAFSNTPDTCRDLEWFCVRYPLELAPEDAEALAAGAREHVERSLRLEEYMQPAREPRRFELALPPRSYQAREAEIVLEQGGLLVADDVGLGKTCAAICVMVEPQARPALVVTLAHLPKQWAAEVKKFAPGLTTYIPKHGTPRPLPEKDGVGPDVIILNYHKLSGWAPILAAYCKSVCFDEVQELRLRSSHKYSAAATVARRMKYRTGLSATPIYNYGDEIYSVLDVLHPGLLGTKTEFEREWCTPIGNGKSKIKDPRAFGAWCREVFAMVRHTRKEVGRELPKVTTVVHTVDADAAALMKVEGRAAELASIILEQAERHRGEHMRAREELSNVLRQATGIAKAPYVAEFVKLLVDSGEKVVLVGWHRAVYEIWEERLTSARVEVAYYTGTETPAQKEQSANRFLEGEAKVLFLSLRAGAGLDGLQKAASVIVFGEIDWSPGVHEQNIGRLDRDGQETPVIAYYLLAEDGADPIMAEVLGLKREQVEGIRDPNHALIEKLESNEDRMRKLAEQYLVRRDRAGLVAQGQRELAV